MNRLLFFSLLLFVLPALSSAQKGVTFRKNDGSNSVIITPGDWVKIETTTGHVAAGKFKTVENDLICLRNGKKIPLDQVSSIRIWPPDVKGFFWLLLLAGIVVLAIGLLTFTVSHSLGGSTKGPSVYIVIGFCLLGISVAANLMARQSADHVQTDWTWETYTMPKLLKEPGKVP